MQTLNLNTKFKALYKKIMGRSIEFDLSPYSAVLNEINNLEKTLTEKSDRSIVQLIEQLRKKDRVPETDMAMIVAIVREAASRVLHLRAFDVQILGALAMNKGRLVQMQTGEGKTLAAVFPAVLHALSGQGVHILTFNDYLARRDAHWMGPVYQFLGMTVGHVQEGMSIRQRQNAYTADITYVTAKEAGFDYLRDSLCYEKKDMVHRPFHFAIIDEADSILIDESRVPMVIAGAEDDFLCDTHYLSGLVRTLIQGVDFEFDEYARNIHLTESGQRKVEKKLECDNLFGKKNIELLTRLNCAIYAEFLLLRDVDYIVRNGKIELVDEFTGRVADRRRWPDGLQAALEQKENLTLQSRGRILNSIPLQHFLLQYPGLCGMTATAVAAEQELKEFYNLDITVIPPNKQCVRVDHPDVVFKNKSAKMQAIIDEIIRVHKTLRPILVGTHSVIESVHLAQELKSRGISCSVLNAKQDEFEARIIAEAGKAGAVTISTNMAGRGTDIRLGGSDEKDKQHVMNLGGLYVIGGNKHESNRIDQQLRGRAARQGDPGSSRFFISLEDDLFIKYRLQELLPAYFFQADGMGSVDHPLITRETSRIQRICDGQNLEIKKTLCKYSNLIENQRQIVFSRRLDILSDHAATEFFKKTKKYEQVSLSMSAEQLNETCANIALFYIDKYWSEYLGKIADVREGIHLHRLGGQDPFLEFQKIAIQTFDDVLKKMDRHMKRTFTALASVKGTVDLAHLGIKAPTATWTYIINDNPFEYNVGVQMIGNYGMQVGAGFAALAYFLRKKPKHA